VGVEEGVRRGGGLGATKLLGQLSVSAAPGKIPVDEEDT